MSIGRRSFLRITVATPVAGSLLTACGDDADGSGPGVPSIPNGTFLHGVASGDPFADSVILWTRVSAQTGPVEVEWEVATSSNFFGATTGTATVDESTDYTLKIEAMGLRPATTYYYRFRVGEDESPIGRTKTLASGSLERTRLAFVSCSNYPAGYFHAYRGIGQREDLDVVLHLGDYIYEYADGAYDTGADIDRVVDVDAETVALADYRARYATYRSDADLQEAHRQHPFITVWDDHESTNDSWVGGAENHQPDAEGDWEARKAASIQAYYEWMPIREPASGDRTEIYRGFTFGDLVDLSMLETRLVGRDAQPTTVEGAQEETRQLLGAEQESWLLGRLRASTATWRLIGQQTQLAELTVPGADNLFFDAWGGYRAQRQRLLSTFRDEGIGNICVLTGDIHSSWASDLFVSLEDYDAATQAGSVAVEFITPSVSSRALGPAAVMAGIEVEALTPVVTRLNPHIRYFDLLQHGYVLLDIDRARVQAEFYYVGDGEAIRSPTFEETAGPVWFTAAGSQFVTEGTAPSVPIAGAPELAP
ncbi:MAG: alkaline phosphatase D family protein [Myxococcota bacterium]